MTYCKKSITMGQGMDAICGHEFYGRIYQCEKCELIDAAQELIRSVFTGDYDALPAMEAKTKVEKAIIRINQQYS